MSFPAQEHGSVELELKASSEGYGQLPRNCRVWGESLDKPSFPDWKQKFIGPKLMASSSGRHLKFETAQLNHYRMK